MTRAYDPMHGSGRDLFSEYVYDKKGNRTFAADNLGLAARYEYDNRQRRLRPRDDHERVEPDALGRAGGRGPPGGAGLGRERLGLEDRR